MNLKYVLFVTGILILTLGISLTIQSELGTSPFDALLVGLSHHLGLLQTNFAPIPIDRLTLILHEITQTPLFVSRTFIYLVFLILAFLLSGPIGLGTLIIVCCAGVLLQFIMGHTKKIIDRILTDMDTSSHTKSEKEHSV